MKASKWIATAAVAWGIGTASAGPLVTYELVMTIEDVQNSPFCAAGFGGSFGCLEAGQTFRGSFSVDSSILAVDGINQTASIFDLHMPFGDALYATGPENLSLAGFRNGLGFAAAPGFVIEGGQVVDLIGGFFGSADVPFIDFRSAGAQTFSALDAVNTSARGSLRITTPVPEAETVAMWLAGMALVGLAARSTRRRRP
jgi:hypothetical protein